ncbi:hypothetical protein C7451_1228 [Blastomonas natatoria]|uniref:Uncharacterized protein n=2 Tax=Blastomonas natatoria TaxID=34015 RepID=A0A2V3UNI7_9SPHN|nr:hypothetical protein C7451_1228 [Blastomonas natatoria]
MERTTGNYAYGNESYMNLSSSNRQSDQWNTAPSFSGGAPIMSSVGANAAITRTTSDGSTIYDTSPAMSRGTDANQSQGFDSSTSDNRSNGSNATQDSGSYSQSGSFSRSEGYSEKAFSREQALEDVRRIDKRIAAIEEVSKSLSSNTSSRDGYGSNLSFDLSQIIASRYQEKAAELGLTAPSLARTDLSPQEQATAEVVARAIIADYYDQRVAPFNDLIPEPGSLVGNVSGPGSFTEADLRGQGPRRSAGSPRNLVEGSSDSTIGDRIEEGGKTLGQRYETNVTRSGQRRQDFQQDRKGEGGADDRFNERFYDKDQR